MPNADRIFDVVFVLVFLFTLLQGPSLPWVAKRLKVMDENAAYEVDIDVAPLESLGADMLQVHVPSESRLAGVEIGELRLPGGVSVSLVIRGDRAFVPDLRTVLGPATPPRRRPQPRPRPDRPPVPSGQPSRPPGRLVRRTRPRPAVRSGQLGVLRRTGWGRGLDHRDAGC